MPVTGARNGRGGLFTRSTRLLLEPGEGEFYAATFGLRPPRTAEERQRRMARLASQYEQARRVGLPAEMRRIAEEYSKLRAEQARSVAPVEVDDDLSAADVDLDDGGFDPDDLVLRRVAPAEIELEEGADNVAQYGAGRVGVEDPYRPGHPYNATGYLRQSYDAGRGG